MPGDEGPWRGVSSGFCPQPVKHGCFSCLKAPDISGTVLVRFILESAGCHEIRHHAYADEHGRQKLSRNCKLTQVSWVLLRWWLQSFNVKLNC